MPDLVLTAAQARRLASGHPWILPEGLAEGRRGLTPGAWVRLIDGRGRSLGTALASPGEPVVARLWSREGEAVGRGTVSGRVAAAWARRAPLRTDGGTDAYRIAHGEADGLPGLFADLWDGVLTLEVQTSAWDPWLDFALDALQRLARPNSLLLRRRIPGPDGNVPEGRAEAVRGQAPEKDKDVEVQEAGLRYRIRPFDAKPGLFADERENRAWLAPRCAGKSVLNTFAFTGAFSVAAAKAGASVVTSLDLAAPILARLEDNLRLNGLDPKRHPAVRGEAMTTLSRWAEEGRRFGVLILDPPAYATHKSGRWRAGRDYPLLAEAAARLVEPGGLLAAALTLHEVSAEGFERMLRAGAAAAGRKVLSLERRGASADFPVLSGFPEGNYLKFAAMRLG